MFFVYSITSPLENNPYPLPPSLVLLLLIWINGKETPPYFLLIDIN